MRCAGKIAYGQKTRNRLDNRGYDLTTAHAAACILSTLSCILHAHVRMEQMEGDGRMDWKMLLAYITGSVDQELLLRNEYLVTENRILRNQLKERIRLSDGERKALAMIGQKLGK